MNFLCLVTSAGTATTSAFEFTSLRSNQWLGVAVGYTRCRSKVFFCFTCFPWALDQDSVFTIRSFNCQLVESQNLTSSLKDPCTCSFSYTKSNNCQLRDFEFSSIVGDGSNDNSRLAFTTRFSQLSFLESRNEPLKFSMMQNIFCNAITSAKLTYQSFQWNWWPINLAHE